MSDCVHSPLWELINEDLVLLKPLQLFCFLPSLLADIQNSSHVWRTDPGQVRVPAPSWLLRAGRRLKHNWHDPNIHVVMRRGSYPHVRENLWIKIMAVWCDRWAASSHLRRDLVFCESLYCLINSLYMGYGRSKRFTPMQNWFLILT